MKKHTKVHIVNHTHWDREWYFTSADALVLSDQIFTDIIDELQENETATFVLDGQISILDDYIQLYPEKMAVIQELVKKQQLFIGPWYTQTDCLYTSGEAILRNLMIGIAETKKYGSYFPIGYLPDTFGFNEQMPTLLRNAGFDNIVFWRGINFKKHVHSPYFKWKEKGSDQFIYALNMPQGYGTGMLLEATSNFVAGRLDPAVAFIKGLSSHVPDEVLIPSGNDQLNIIENMQNKIEEINQIGQFEYLHSTYQKFLSYVKSLSDLEIYEGEFREPVYARVHRTIGSSRMDLKIESQRVEKKLVRRIEPLMVIARKCQIQLSNRLLQTAWKKLLEGQAHDSLAGCVSDAVAQDILHRLKEANEILDSIENTIVKAVAEQLELTEKEVLVFNLQPQSFVGFKEIRFISETKNIRFEHTNEAYITHCEEILARETIMEETAAGNQFITEPGYLILDVSLQVKIPALSYTIVRFEKSEVPLSEFHPVKQNFIENASLKVTFDQQNLIGENRAQKLHSFITLIDEGNLGDTYDFSPLAHVQPIELHFQECTVFENQQSYRMILSGKQKLPLTLENRKEANYNTDFPFELVIETDKKATGFRCSLTVDNTVFNHRVRMVIDSGIKQEMTLASVPFGYTKRWKEKVIDWENNYAEYPVDIYPLGDTVSIFDDTQTFSVLGSEWTEFQIVDSGKIALTLLATTDELGKPDLIYRPGRASGDTTKKGHVRIATPEAQLLKKQTVSFGINLSAETFFEAKVAKENNDYLNENVSYQRQEKNKFMHRIDNKIQKSHREILTPQLLDWFELPAGLICSACYPAYYNQDSFIIRIENPTKETITIDEAFRKKYQPEQINVLEEKQEQKELIVKPYNMLTLQIRYER